MAPKTAKAPPWSQVLIAHRGEIAVRIAASLRALGLQPVAIYSSADATALHVQRCDQAFWVGPAAPQQSYLRADRIVAAARQAGADAVHPGYGFLAENADFATAVAAAGMTFIGPPPAAIRAMGNKTRARELMQAAGVPTVPGGEIGTDDALLQVGELAAHVGYPIMLKAAAGGGGKGMRRVTEAAALGGALLRARSEAQTAFGDATVYIEKYLAQPRHIEVQIVGDVDGRIVVLGDRECSMQRRHQKVIEESPAAHLAAPLRARLHAVAAQAAAAVDYRGAGTVEFLVDGDALYFLEMNTRLQVEHGVTEACFGVDLVAAQLRVAQGQKLGWQTGALHSRGHAIEARLYAEDPRRDFLPCPGTLASLEFFEAPGIRGDPGGAPPCEV